MFMSSSYRTPPVNSRCQAAPGIHHMFMSPSYRTPSVNSRCRAAPGIHHMFMSPSYRTSSVNSRCRAAPGIHHMFMSPSYRTPSVNSRCRAAPGIHHMFMSPSCRTSSVNSRWRAGSGIHRHNGASMLEGINVSANQDEETDCETFQMQINRDTKKCSFHTNSGRYWTLVTHGGIQSTATETAPSTMFEIEWRGRKVALKAGNGKYICTKKNGQLAAVSDSVGEDEEFTLKLINRPILVLRGDLGFVCYHKSSNTLDANRSSYDVFQIIFTNGAYQIKGQGGKFWYTSSNGTVCTDGDMSEDFFFEFREYNRVAIKGKNGRYLRGDQAGTLRADAESVNAATLWEY